MKRAFFLLSVCSCLSLCAQQNTTEILKSKNIKEIENFLENAQLNDPRIPVLQTKLQTLQKNPNAKRTSSVYKQSASVSSAFAVKKTIQSSNSEAEEFSQLLMLSSKDHKAKTVQLLNKMFDNDETSREAILLVQNNSDCNMIVRIKGKEFYSLAIPAHGENSLVLKKDQYQLSGNACDAKYASSKNIAKNMLVVLNGPSSGAPAPQYAQTANGTRSPRSNSQK